MQAGAARVYTPKDYPLNDIMADIVKLVDGGCDKEAFATALGIPVATLRNWEQGRNAIDPAVRALLVLVARDPKGALAALAAARAA